MVMIGDDWGAMDYMSVRRRGIAPGNLNRNVIIFP